LLLLLLVFREAKADPILEIRIGSESHHFGRDELLLRPDVATVEVANGFNLPADSILEAAALDGFAAQLPLDLVLNGDSDQPVAWVAIEPGDRPWPLLPNKAVSAGPFYIVWTGASGSEVRSEQWPYQLAKLETKPLPEARWPELQVDAALPATHPARAGLALFVTQCLPCHTINGAGASTLGPDLNQPMNPTEYLTQDGLRAVIRNPRSVRSWPGLQMPAFSRDQMTDHEIDIVIAYLAHIAARPRQQ
jgi:mono/diheme cytochrome c family protein